MSSRPTRGSAVTPVQAGLLTMVAMVAFAANSVLCRAALGTDRIDPASFTAVRVLSGAVSLASLAALTGGPGVTRGGSWRAAALLLWASAASAAPIARPRGTRGSSTASDLPPASSKTSPFCSLVVAAGVSASIS